jgi:RNA recognition motif-containing protein
MKGRQSISAVKHWPYDYLKAIFSMQLEEDVKEECPKYGTVEGVVVPRPPDNVPPTEPGRVYVRFATAEETKKAKDVFHGRQFDGNSIVAKYVPEEEFDRVSGGAWLGGSGGSALPGPPPISASAVASPAAVAAVPATGDS